MSLLELLPPVQDEVDTVTTTLSGPIEKRTVRDLACVTPAGSWWSVTVNSISWNPCGMRSLGTEPVAMFHTPRTDRDTCGIGLLPPSPSGSQSGGVVQM